MPDSKLPPLDLPFEEALRRVLSVAPRVEAPGDLESAPDRASRPARGPARDSTRDDH